MLTEQLLTDTHTKDGLTQTADDLVETTLTQVGHGTACLALTGEDHTVGLLQQTCIVGENRIGTETTQGIEDRADVSCIIFDYSEHCFKVKSEQ